MKKHHLGYYFFLSLGAEMLRKLDMVKFKDVLKRKLLEGPGSNQNAIEALNRSVVDIETARVLGPRSMRMTAGRSGDPVTPTCRHPPSSRDQKLIEDSPCASGAQ